MDAVLHRSKSALAASELAAAAPWATTSTSVSSTKTSAQPWQTVHPLPPSRHLRRAVRRDRRLCKQASSSQLVRRRTAAHQRRPAVICRADLSFRVPVSDEAVGFTGVVRCGYEDAGMVQNFIPCDRGQVMLLPLALGIGCRRITSCGRCLAPSSRWMSMRSMGRIVRMGRVGRRMTRR